jgi:hypothetical protein
MEMSMKRILSTTILMIFISSCAQLTNKENGRFVANAADDSDNMQARLLGASKTCKAVWKLDNRTSQSRGPKFVCVAENHSSISTICVDEQEDKTVLNWAIGLGTGWEVTTSAKVVNHDQLIHSHKLSEKGISNFVPYERTIISSFFMTYKDLKFEAIKKESSISNTEMKFIGECLDITD